MRSPQGINKTRKELKASRRAVSNSDVRTVRLTLVELAPCPDSLSVHIVKASAPGARCGESLIAQASAARHLCRRDTAPGCWSPGQGGPSSGLAVGQPYRLVHTCQRAAGKHKTFVFIMFKREKANKQKAGLFQRLRREWQHLTPELAPAGQEGNAVHGASLNEHLVLLPEAQLSAPPFT